uniref:Proteasome subunit alpha type n=1 Tax=Panagrolaimus sp. JU765 TaxID=591449 RepID=A0AC34RQF2_9BILA
MWHYAPINEFAPDGHLKQVDYASKAAELGNSVVGIVGKSCIVIASMKKEDNPLLVSNSASSIFQIDDGIIAAFSGLPGDAGPLANGARLKVSKAKFEYGETPSLKTVSQFLIEKMQHATMMSNTRPFGVSIMLGGVVDRRELMKITADGTCSGCKAGAIGKRAVEITTYLEENFNEELLTNENLVIQLAIKSLRQIAVFSGKDVEVAVLTGQGRYANYRTLTQPEKQTIIEAL